MGRGLDLKPRLISWVGEIIIMKSLRGGGGEGREGTGREKGIKIE